MTLERLVTWLRLILVLGQLALFAYQVAALWPFGLTPADLHAVVQAMVMQAVLLVAWASTYLR